ncbi:MAG: hypothetical protein BMS9Abin05_2490 [Rhodothermia bacterium]|nr:MAG: hypothetical protein BMS9Abin05_2490 [Rhodothermia bacterium]
MQQTILAMLALMIVGSFTLNQQRGAAKTYNELVDDELEIAASGVAMHVMELIGNRAFDSRTLPDQTNVSGMLVGSSELTAESAFGKQGTTCDLDEPFKDTSPCLDIDDADMAPDQWQDVPFRLKDGKELPFDVRVEVFYVDPSDLDKPLPTGQRSLHKKVIVKVRAKRHVRQNRYNDGFVRLERIFSYDIKKAENRLREKYGPTVVETPTDPPPPPPPPPPDPNVTPKTDPNALVAICHRRVKRGKITWKNRTVKQKFVKKHIGHGDKLGSC